MRGGVAPPRGAAHPPHMRVPSRLMQGSAAAVPASTRVAVASPIRVQCVFDISNTHHDLGARRS